MRWLLDTNVVSEGPRTRPNPQVIDWIAAQPSRDLVISAITLAELRVGARAVVHAARRAAVTQWIETEVLGLLGDEPIPVSVEILVDWLKLSRGLRAGGKPRDPADMLLAATARVHNLTLVTRNVRDFADTGIVVYDPWHDRTHRMDQP